MSHPRPEPKRELPNLPWLPGYVPPATGANVIGDLVKTAETVTQDATQVATDVGSAVAGEVVGPTAAAVVEDVGGAAQSVEQAGGAVIGAVTGSPVSTATTPVAAPTPTATSAPTLSPSSSVGPLTTNDILSAIESAATSSAKTAVLSAIPDLKASLEQKLEDLVTAKGESELQQVLKKLDGGSSQADIPVPSVDDFIKADARSRAIRTLIIGLVVSVGWGLVNAVGALAGVNWFDSHVWPSLIALAVGSVVSSVTSYVARLAKEPAHTAPVVAALTAVSPAGGK